MMNQLLPFAQPLCLAWLLLTLWVLDLFWRRPRRTLLPFLSWFILTTITCTALPSWLMAKLEDRYPLPDEKAVAGADVLVCLGGGVEPSPKEPTGLHLVRSSDRLVAALSLMASRAAPVLVLGGGGYEDKDGGGYISEADAILALLQKYPQAVPFESISLGVCENTYDEARKVAALQQARGWKKVLLVTSASHLPRAVATFEKAGMTVVPVPCNYQSSYNRLGKVDWFHLPHDGAFDIFDAWLHEILGTWIYRQRGWLD